MSDVTGHDVGKSPHRHGLAARRSRPPPRLVVQPAQNREVRLPQLAEFLDEIRKAAAIETGTRDVVVFVEARQRIFVATTETERAEAKHPLGVRHVAEHLPHAPLAFGVAECLPRRDERARALADVGRLPLEDLDDVGLGDKRHVARVERCELDFSRPSDLKGHTTATFTQWIGGSESNRQLHSSPPSRPIQSWPVVVPK